MDERDFQRFGGACAVLAGIVGLAYAVSFVLIARVDAGLGNLLSSAFLFTGGLLSTAVFVAIYDRLRVTAGGFARWALVLGLAGAVGSTIHGAYDLANAINPPVENVPSLAELPSQIDPRGVLTFGITGIAVLVASWLISRDERWSRGLGTFGYAAGALLVVIYLGRLIVLDPTSPLILVPAALAGFVVNPAWLVWIGIELRRGPRLPATER